MLRIAAYAALVAAFSVFAFIGVRGWTRPREAPAPTAPPADETPPADEHALRTGFLYGTDASHYGSMGNPWSALRPEMLAAARDLPPDPAPLSEEDAEKRNRIILFGLKFRLPPGRYAWRDLFPLIREQIEPSGVKVTTGSPKIADDYPVVLPDIEWTGLSIFGEIMKRTNKEIVYAVTSEGVNVGTDEACNRAARDASLVVLRRRVARENDADTRLDAEFRPDVRNANIVAFLRGMEAQTGVEVALETRIWEMAPALSWRAPPMKLRAALDELCRGFHWYWRSYRGRVWILRP
jgi:hypothetical protein